MKIMKFPCLLAIVLCALPLAAQSPAPASSGSQRRVAAPCQFVSGQLSLSAEDSPDKGRGYSFQVVNNSKRTIAISAKPDFGWRVETLEKHGWKLKAEGGPVRLLTTSGRSDPHVAVTGPSSSHSVLQIAPTHGFDFSFYLPDAEAALRPDPGVMLTSLKLTVYWAAPADLVQQNRDVPLCSVSGQWDVKIQAP